MTLETLKVNEQAIHAIVNANPTAHAAALFFAKRNRHTESFPIPVLKTTLMRNSGAAINEQDLYQYLQGLQDQKLGAIVYAKKGGVDTFKWNYHIHLFNRIGFEPGYLSTVLKEDKKVKAKVLAQRYAKDAPVTLKRGRGRPKGSLNKQVLRASPMAIKPSQDRRYLAIPLKGNRDIKIEMPSDINPNEVALLNLTINEITNKA